MNQDDMYRLGEKLNISTNEINTSYVNNLSDKKTNNMTEVTPEALKLWLNAQPTDVNTSFMKTFPAENTKKANLKILKSWLKKQPSREAAYITMGEALIDAGLPLIAREVLDYPPSKPETTQNGCKKRKYSDMRQETCSNDVPCS